jgi:hypothetical protein
MTTINRIHQKLGTAVLVSVFALGTAGCDEFLDVNTNPNAPEHVTPNLYLPPMMHWLATSEQFDGRYIGRYAQEWVLPQGSGTTPNVYERHGYEAGLDVPAQLYRDIYWNFGQNLGDMIALAEEQERWDVVGVGHVLRAWGWLTLTDLHGEIPVLEAFTPDQFTFKFDTQEDIYEEILRLLDLAIVNLQKTDGKVSAAYLGAGDKMYNGDRVKWLKFAYGLKARALNHYSNKPSLDKPADVIAAVDLSLASNADDALFLYPNTATDNGDRNFWGTTRGNIQSFRQTTFVVGLMNGTQYTGAVDPRMSKILAQDSTGTYRGIDPNVGYGTLLRERPWNLWGYYGTGLAGPGQQGRYLFDDRAKFPIMTYAQLQFIKAEAALRMGNQALARQAYLNGVSAHIDFVNARNAEVANPSVPQITAAEKAAFLANPAIAPATITMSHILGQKFIAQWAWAHTELWLDLRRFHYTDIDPVSGTQVFRGWTFPASFFVDNNNKPVQRIRPRYNSDYVWNRAELEKIGGLQLDYHTKPLWITER